MKKSILHAVGISLLLTLPIFSASAQKKSLEESAKLFIPLNEGNNVLPVEVISGKSCSLANKDQSLGKAVEDKFFGSALSFSDPDGAKANRIRTAEIAPVSGKAARTYAFWVYLEREKNYFGKFKPTHPASAIRFQNDAQIFTTGGNSAGMNGFTLSIQAHQHVKVIAAPQTQVEFKGNYIMQDGWHHIAFVVNEGGTASNCECYINGESLGEARSYCGDIILQNDFIINTQPTPIILGQNLNGRLSNFILFDKALSRKEVKRVMQDQWRKEKSVNSKALLADVKNRIKSREKEVASWKNPIIKHMFTADPSARVFGDRLYVYASHDMDPARNCDRMDRYHIFSTKDMKKWKDHGEILAAEDVPWGRPEGGFMWAPDCVYRNGKYYFYYPHPSGAGKTWNTTWKIGVAVSDRPDGGFDPSAEAAGVDGFKGYIEGMEPFIDPCVFVDDDGQAYIYQGGGGVCYGGKLKENMVELDGKMEHMLDGKGTIRKFRGKEYPSLSIFHEGTWVFKRNGIYYLTAPDDHPMADGGNQLIYYTSDKPLGPWKYGGVYLEPTGCGTSHGSVVEYKGQWYAFYHNCRLSAGDGAVRSVCVDKLFFNEDGSIQMVKQTF